VPFLRELVTDMSQRRSDFDPRLVYVEFVFGQRDNGNINVANNNSVSTIICLIYKSYLFLQLAKYFCPRDYHQVKIMQYTFTLILFMSVH